MGELPGGDICVDPALSVLSPMNYLKFEKEVQSSCCFPKGAVPLFLLET
jgi:hypothetical protein